MHAFVYFLILLHAALPALSGGGIFDPELAELLRNVSASADLAAFRWRSPRLLRPDMFNVTVGHTPCPGQTSTSSAAVQHVYCGELHPEWAGHYAHLAEVLFACWSFFQQQSAAQWHLLKAHDRNPDTERSNDRKIRAKLRQLGLSISVADNITALPCTSYQLVLRKNRTSRDGHLDREGALGFMSHAAAASFRDTVLGWQEESADPSLVVGLLGRRRYRKLANAQTVRQYILSQRPTAKVFEVEDIEDIPSMQQQCQWINGKHLLISAHGAQLTNLFCGAPCAVLLELYPDKYFIPGY